MYLDAGRNAWVASGIVSFGATECGTAGVPGVYTKIYHYIDWIHRKLEKQQKLHRFYCGKYKNKTIDVG